MPKEPCAAYTRIEILRAIPCSPRSKSFSLYVESSRGIRDDLQLLADRIAGNFELDLIVHSVCGSLSKRHYDTYGGCYRGSDELVERRWKRAGRRDESRTKHRCHVSYKIQWGSRIERPRWKMLEKTSGAFICTTTIPLSTSPSTLQEQIQIALSSIHHGRRT